MTSLPHDVGRLAARIRRSIETFAGELPRSQQGFLFVLEDTALARVVGVSAIEVAVARRAVLQFSHSENGARLESAGSL